MCKRKKAEQRNKAEENKRPSRKRTERGKKEGLKSNRLTGAVFPLLYKRLTESWKRLQERRERERERGVS